MSDPLLPVLLILRYMHILGAIALMGGTIFMRFALRPVVVQLAPETKAAIHEQVRSRWSKFVMLASALLLLSGIINLAMTGRSNAAKKVQNNAEFWMNLNLSLALVMVLMGGLLKFVQRKPKAERQVQAAILRLVEQNASEKLPFSTTSE